MLAYQVHDVRITPQLREVPPEDGWKRWETTGFARLACSCGHIDGPTWTSLALLLAQLHIRAQA